MFTLYNQWHGTNVLDMVRKCIDWNVLRYEMTCAQNKMISKLYLTIILL